MLCLIASGSLDLINLCFELKVHGDIKFFFSELIIDFCVSFVLIHILLIRLIYWAYMCYCWFIGFVDCVANFLNISSP